MMYKSQEARKLPFFPAARPSCSPLAAEVGGGCWTPSPWRRLLLVPVRHWPPALFPELSAAFWIKLGRGYVCNSAAVTLLKHSLGDLALESHMLASLPALNTLSGWHQILVSSRTPVSLYTSQTKLSWRAIHAVLWPRPFSLLHWSRVMPPVYVVFPVSWLATLICQAGPRWLKGWAIYNRS